MIDERLPVEMVLDHGEHGVLDVLLLGAQLHRHLSLKLLGQAREKNSLRYEDDINVKVLGQTRKGNSLRYEDDVRVWFSDKTRENYSLRN